MPKTKNKPGPKPGTTKKYGERRDYHFRLTSDVLPGETMSLADAFDSIAAGRGGDNAFIVQILREHPAIQAKLKGTAKP